MDRPELPVEEKGETVDPPVHYLDRQLLIVEKPAGLPTTPLKGGRRSLAEQMAERFPELTSLPDLGACHRLDNETSGLVVFARNLKTYEKMREAFSQDRVGREYRALVQGVVSGPTTIDRPIGPDPKSSKKVKVYKTDAEARRHGAQPAKTTFRPLKRIGGDTEVTVTIRGGRRHQVRAHLASVGHPVLWLHATRLTFRHPGSGARIDLRSEPPRGSARATKPQSR